jgi:hypothetical protein
VLFLSAELSACTTAIFSGRATVDGRPVLWKNRDTSSIQNQVFSFHDGQFSYYGIVNGGDLAGLNIWAGINETGFSIMNSASYNIEKKGKPKDGEGRFMKLALQTCRTVDDFEALLERTRFFRDVNANFGVIDAHGGAAFFETNGEFYKKYDANDPQKAPDGYLIRTNYSDQGPEKEGYGFIRRERAETLVSSLVSSSTMSVDSLILNVFRDLTIDRTGVSPLTQKGKRGHYLDASDTINRYSTVSSTVIRGVTKDQDPTQSVFWVLLGHPACGLAVPLFLSDFAVPDVLGGGKSSAVCDLSLKLKALLFPYGKKHGSLYKYLDANVLTGFGGGTDLFHEIISVQENIFKTTENYLRERNADISQDSEFQVRMAELARFELNRILEKVAGAQKTSQIRIIK